MPVIAFPTQTQPMPSLSLVHELIALAANQAPTARALTYGTEHLSYAALWQEVNCLANGLLQLGLARGDRVAVYLEKRLETPVGIFAPVTAGGAFVPINPLLKAEQVRHILADCNVRFLITTAERLALIQSIFPDCPDLQHVILIGQTRDASQPGPNIHAWSEVLQAQARAGHRTIDTDMAGILYTSGSTGHPKGVVVSHRNLVAGAQSVASYLGNHADDTLLAALPLSFDAGLSQLTTAFHAGARVVLLNYLLPRDVIKAIEREKVTGLTAVPPLYLQLAQLNWPAEITEHLRYFANTGGRLPVDTLRTLRRHLPKTQTFLMYGLTEAFRSTYLPPSDVENRPDSIGKAIPNAEILVLREDGTPCAPDEPGELVHRGPLVSLGYWNDPAKTAERFKPLPAGLHPGRVLPEIAVFSGDTVRQDAEGYLYFIGRKDEMIKTSGYRVSPSEVEEILYRSGLVSECAAYGVDDPMLGQAIHVALITNDQAPLDNAQLLQHCRAEMPAYMVPKVFDQCAGPLPRNPNGKIDRKRIAADWQARHHQATELRNEPTA